MADQDEELIEKVFKLLGRSREEETLLWLKDGADHTHADLLSSHSLQKIRSFEILFNMLGQFLQLDFRTVDELRTLEWCLEIATPQQCASLWQLYNKRKEDAWARAHVVSRLEEKLRSA